jgi:hypothetical protein
LAANMAPSIHAFAQEFPDVPKVQVTIRVEDVSKPV